MVLRPAEPAVSLSLLRIENLAIIERSELELGPGLNVITGETGAGKSILVGALALVLGGRGDAGLVRTGADRATVEALFDLTDSPDLRGILEAEGIEADDELVIRRVVLKSGRSRAYLNNRLTSAKTLRRLARGLVDISSQHEHHTLVDARTHIDHLDAFAALEASRGVVAGAHKRLTAALAALRDAESGLRARAEREDLLRFQLGEVDALKPELGELDTLEAEADRMRHAAVLSEAATSAENALYGADRAVATQLDQVARDLAQAARRDPTLRELVERLEAARMEVEEVARDLERYGAGLTHDPRQLSAAEERLQALRRLVRKHGHTLEELLAWAEGARGELDRLSQGEAHIEALSRALSEAEQVAREAARALSSARRAAAAHLGDAMTHELSSLGMGGAQVLVDVASVEAQDNDGSVTLDGHRFTARGTDRVEFLIAPNPGEEPRPLAKVASGGELSRALLALKRVLAGIGPVGLYVFDEVDTGVGGAIAEVIGQKLADIAAHHQVLCITHSPQVAVYAHRHLHVRKHTEGGRTRSQVQALSEADHRAEISRMLGGIDVTEAARDAAVQLREAALEAGARAL